MNILLKHNHKGFHMLFYNNKVKQNEPFPIFSNLN